MIGAAAARKVPHQRHCTTEQTMKSTTTTLLLASALAIAASAAFAGSSHCHGRYCYDTARVHYRPTFDSWSEWRYRRLYHQRDGYYPDYRGCFPGICRDNPYY
jgi:hypothetical protein